MIEWCAAGSSDPGGRHHQNQTTHSTGEAVSTTTNMPTQQAIARDIGVTTRGGH